MINLTILCASRPRLIKQTLETIGDLSNATVTITNCGTALLHITGNGVSGPATSDYNIIGPTCIGPIPTNNGTCTFSVRFAPSTNGLRSAVLTITNDAPTRVGWRQ